MMKIYCENRLCIYWEENACILSGVSMDSLGMCEECILVSLEDEELDKKRKQLRQKFSSGPAEYRRNSIRKLHEF